MNHTEEQRAAITSDASHICVDAAAGSGKTRVLVERILHLLETGQAELEEIVAITFTEKAAGEMRARLRAQFLARAKRSMDSPESMTKWRGLERRLDGARISTIHSFGAGLLRQHAVVLGRDPDFVTLTETEATLLQREVATRRLHALLDGEAEHSVEDGLHAAAVRLAATFPFSRVRKTLCTLLERRTDTLEAFERMPRTPEEVRAYWSREVPKERERWLLSLRRSSEVWRWLAELRRFEGCCSDPEERREKWRRQMITVFERLPEAATADEVRALLSLIQTPPGQAQKKKYRKEEDCEALGKLQDRKIRPFVEEALAETLADPVADARSAQLTCDLRRVFEHVVAAYRASKEAENCVDFDDLILGARDLLRDDETLWEKTARGIRFLFMDEFQDTDPAQLEIARLLHDVPGGPKLFIVGDAKQSIYRFRGARVEVYQAEKARALEEPGGAVLPLRKNFRSSAGVLAFINDFFAKTQLLCAVEDYTAMAAAREGEGAACVEFLLPSFGEQSGDAAGEGVAVVAKRAARGRTRSAAPEETGSGTPSEAAKTGRAGQGPEKGAEEWRREEAAAIASRIRMMCSGEDEVRVCDGGNTRPPRYGDMALLFRRLGSVHLYENALREAGIPYVVVGGRGFFVQQEVTDLINLLKVVCDPWDEVALLGFLRGPLAALSDETILRLAWGEDRPRQRALGGLAGMFQSEATPAGIGQEEAEALAWARTLVRDLQSCVEQPLPDFLHEAMLRAQYEAVLLSQFLGVQKAANVRKVIDLADQFSARRPPTLRGFVEYLEESQDPDLRVSEAALQPEGSDAVTLLTVHKAKGLEFPIVFVPETGGRRRSGNEADVILHRELGAAVKSIGDDGEVQTPAMGEAIGARLRQEEEAESARLLYVAMTRARDHLVICGVDGHGDASWFHAFDVCFGLSAGATETIAGTGWRARVVRDLRSCDPAGSDVAARALPSREALLARAQPVVESAPRQTVSVSALLGVLDDAAESELVEASPPVGGAPPEARRLALLRGELAHRMLERWKFGNALPDTDELVRDAGTGLAQQQGLSAYLREAASRFAASPLAARMASAKRLSRETPFLLRLGETILAGKIDAVIDDAIIVDYKTGERTPEKVRQYREQLLLYAVALHELRGVIASEGMIYFLDSGASERFVVTAQELGEAVARAQRAMRALACGTGRK